MTAIAKDETHGANDANVLSDYLYNGAGRLVIEDYKQAKVRLDYYDDYQGAPVAGTYEGFDRFGRVSKQIWRDYDGAGAYNDQYAYGYDRNSNRTYRKNELATDRSWLYGYGSLDRLTDAQRGTLNEAETAILNTPARQQDWTLTQTGNWAGFDVKNDGSPVLTQTRTANRANEITSTTEAAGQTQWAAPAYDARGNMTSVPLPDSPAVAMTCIYDAWNRLAKVKIGDVTIGEYEYDGLNRRIVKAIDTQAPGIPDGVDTWRHFYYSVGWQVLETRKTLAAETEPEDDSVKPEHQYVWSVRYIDAPVLRDTNRNGDGDCTDAEDQRLYYCNDANMNVTALVDTSGAVQERYTYDPYGKVTVHTPGWVETAWDAGKKNEILYCGYRYDPETGLYCVRNRYYHAELGRWMQRDPAGYADGSSLYEYALSSPSDHADALGNQARSAPASAPAGPREPPQAPVVYLQYVAVEQRLLEDDKPSWQAQFGLYCGHPLLGNRELTVYAMQLCWSHCMYTYAEDEELHVITSMRLDVARYAPDRGAWSQAVDDKVGSLGAGTRPDRATVGRRRICYAEELRQCWLGFGDKTKLPARVVNIPPNTPLRVRWPNATMEDAQQWIAMIRPDTLKQYTFSYVFYRGFAEELNLDPDIEGVTQWHFEGKPPGG